MLFSEEINEYIGIFADGMQFSSLMVLLLLFCLHKRSKAVYWRMYGIILGFLFVVAVVKFFANILSWENADVWYVPYVLSGQMLVPLFEGLFYSMYCQDVPLKKIVKRVVRGLIPYVIVYIYSMFFGLAGTVKWGCIGYTVLYGMYAFVCTALRTRQFNRQIGYAYSDVKSRNLKWVRAVLFAAVILLCALIISKLFLSIWIRVMYDVVSVFIYTGIGIFLFLQEPVNNEMVDNTRLLMDGDMIDNVRVKLNGRDNESVETKMNSRVLLEVGDKLNLFIRETKLYLKADITINEFALAMGINPVHLSYYINTEMGVSFVNFINDLRLDCAIELLMSDKTMTEESVAQMTGFYDSHYMQKLFQDRFDCSIDDYRNSGGPKQCGEKDSFLKKCTEEYPNYHENLLTYEPNLTDNEIILAMMVVMGFSFNKVVDCLHTSPASLDIKYCRLRSKLRLLRNDSLKSTLESILVKE